MCMHRNHIYSIINKYKGCHNIKMLLSVAQQQLDVKVANKFV